MKQSIVEQRLAKLLGLEDKVPVPESPEVVREKETAAREAEGLIAFFREPRAFTEKRCGTCNRVFIVNRNNISQCSDECRTKHLLDNLGLVVDLTQRTPEERWAHNTGGPEPLIVPPAVVEFLTRRCLQQQSETSEEESHQPVETLTDPPNEPSPEDYLQEVRQALDALGL